MRIIIDIGHPAHVHLFKHTAASLVKNGWEVMFSVREKGENVDLLVQYGFDFVIYGHTNRSIVSKILSLAQKNYSLYRVIKEFKPSITISHSSFYLAQVSWLCRIPNLTLEDTGNMEQILLYLPFTKYILTPKDYNRNHGKKHLYYDGFHETAYILPLIKNQNDFSNEKSTNIILIRLVDWAASHDFGHSGLTSNTIDEIINLVGSRFQIKILSEKPLPAHLHHLALKIQASQLHDLLNNVRLYIGEGATLASECALMGIPSVYVNSRSAGVINAQVEAGLLYHFKSSERVLDKIKDILSDDKYFSHHKTLAQEFLRNKIDLSKFLVWFIENYPTSASIMKENPDYQYNFR
ncbi:MAG: DUF354 domain-containing protein [Bacteroidales bacterium]|nr:DUF354 domain-containing protein [Bacteroidales bacterium]